MPIHQKNNSNLQPLNRGLGIQPLGHPGSIVGLCNKMRQQYEDMRQQYPLFGVRVGLHFYHEIQMNILRKSAHKVIIMIQTQQTITTLRY